MRQAFWPPSLQMCARCIQNVCLAHQKRKCSHRFQGPQAVCGPHWLWQIESKRSLAAKFFWFFAGFWKKLICKLGVLLARPSVCLGRGGSGGRLWLFWAAWAVGGAAGGTAAAPAAEKTCFDRFGRLRVGKSSTRMANRCPRIFDAGGKAGDQVGL